MTRTPTASPSRSLPSLRSGTPTEDSVPVEVREAAGAGTELPESDTEELSEEDRRREEEAVRRAEEEAVELLDQGDLVFEDDPPSKAQKVKRARSRRLPWPSIFYC